LGGQQITLRPLTTGEFLELIYLASDVLHTALMAWATKQETYSLVTVLLNNLDKEDAIQVMMLFLPVGRDWLEEHTTPDELYEVVKESVNLNNWSEILQSMIVLDMFKFDEVMDLWQTVKAS